MSTALRSCNWTFGDDVYAGFTDDSYWNGFLNVWVTPEVFAKVTTDLGVDDDWDEEQIKDWKERGTQLEDGLVNLGFGYCTEEVILCDKCKADEETELCMDGSRLCAKCIDELAKQ